MTLQKRIKTWQDAAKHHALPYYGVATVIEPFLLQKNLTVKRVHVIQTWLETPSNNQIRVTYKRAAQFNGRRIEVRVNNEQPKYFGPSDVAAIQTLLRSIP